MTRSKRLDTKTQELRAALARLILGMPVRNLQQPETMAAVTKALELLVPGTKWSDVTSEQLVQIAKGKA